jgi:hypothetical protein
VEEQRFDRMVLVRRGNEGHVTVGGLFVVNPGWALFWAAVVALGVLAAVADDRAGDDAYSLLLMAAAGLGTAALTFGSISAAKRHLITRVRELRVYEAPGVPADDYRHASSTPMLRLRAGRRDVPLEDVRSVTWVSRLLKYKTARNVWRYRIYVVLRDCVLHVGTIEGSPRTVKRYTAALSDLLGGAPVRTATWAFSESKLGSVVSVGMGFAYLITVFAVDATRMRRTSLGVLAAALFAIRFAVIPWLAARTDLRMEAGVFELTAPRAPLTPWQKRGAVISVAVFLLACGVALVR